MSKKVTKQRHADFGLQPNPYREEKLFSNFFYFSSINFWIKSPIKRPKYFTFLVCGISKLLNYKII